MPTVGERLSRRAPAPGTPESAQPSWCTWAPVRAVLGEHLGRAPWAGRTEPPAVTVKARLNEGEPATDYVECIKSMVCVEQSNSPACKRDGLVSGLLTFALSRCSAYKVRTLLKGVNQSPVLLNGLGLKRGDHLASPQTEITDKVSVSSVTSRDQERDATLCTANQYVKSNVCTDCAAGTTNRAGDDPSGADTTCDATLCTANKYVKSNVCTDCAPGTTNVAGDNASGANTTCDATLCKANQYVKSNVCTDCAPGTTNVAGDNASGQDTTCDATLCKANQYVKSNVCTDCESGTTNVAGDNASGADTECDDGGDGGDGGGG